MMMCDMQRRINAKLQSCPGSGVPYVSAPPPAIIHTLLNASVL